MPNEILEPIVQKDTLSRGVEEEVMAYLDEVIFIPLFALLAENGVNPGRSNAMGSAVASALQAQTLHYADGKFTGTFGSTVAKELREMGATYNPSEKYYTIPPHKIPMELRAVAADAAAKSKRVSQQALDMIKEIQENLDKSPTGIKLEKEMGRILGDLHKQFKRSFPSGVGIPADFTDQTKADITRSYTENMDLLIKGFAQKRLPVMRRMIQENVFAGARTDKLARILQAEHGISKRKAQFLADQETSLLVSKYRESRYKQVGARQYIWKTSRDARVRHDHADLNNQVFSWDNPPITNKSTGARNNPGEDFGCRCVARPILDIEED